LLKTLLWTSAWAPMRVLMAVLMLSGQSVSLTVAFRSIPTPVTYFSKYEL
jgi:hypothetical protein